MTAIIAGEKIANGTRNLTGNFDRISLDPPTPFSSELLFLHITEGLKLPNIEYLKRKVIRSGGGHPGRIIHLTQRVLKEGGITPDTLSHAENTENVVYIPVIWILGFIGIAEFIYKLWSVGVGNTVGYTIGMVLYLLPMAIMRLRYWMRK